MSRRQRLFTNAMTVVMVVVVIGLLVYNIVATQRLARERAAASLESSRQNGQVLDSVEQLVLDALAAQVNQRHAFRKLARRNEELHGGDAADAPDFRSLTDRPNSTNPPSPARTPNEPGAGNDRRRDNGKPDSDDDPPERDPRPRPTPRPSPSPPPDKICAPLLDICVDRP